jgi:hypothetical protein
MATGEFHVASESENRLERLTQVCVDDIISAFGLGSVSHGGTILESLSRIPARRLAHQILTYDIFARLTSGLAIVPVVVSGVISPSALRNPLIHLRRRSRDREWLAATLQVLVPALRNVDGTVEFGHPIHAEAVAAIGEAVIEETRQLMENSEKA